MDPFAEQSRAFIHWFRSSGGFISDKISLCDLRNSAQGRGILANADIKPDEILFRIPLSIVLSAKECSLRSVCPAKWDAWIAGPAYNNWHALIMALTYEFRLGNNSKWAPYISLLPERFDQLMFWSESELSLLKPSLIVSRIGKEGAELMFAEIFGNLAPQLGLADVFRSVTLAEFHRAASVILAYSFDVGKPESEETEEEAEEEEEDGEHDVIKSLVPLADLLNADTRLCNANLTPGNGELIMISVEPISAGSQVYNTYGDFPNAEILRRYGYVEFSGSLYDVAEVPAGLLVQAVAEVAEAERNGNGNGSVEPQTENGSGSGDGNYHKSNNPASNPAFSPAALQKLLEELETGEDGEAEVAADSYDVFADGEAAPEAIVAIHYLLCLARNGPNGVPTRNKLRLVRKLAKLTSEDRVLPAAKKVWKRVLQLRLSEYSEAEAERQSQRSNLQVTKPEFGPEVNKSRAEQAKVVLEGEMAVLRASEKWIDGLAEIPEGEMQSLYNKIVTKRGKEDGGPRKKRK